MPASQPAQRADGYGHREQCGLLPGEADADGEQDSARDEQRCHRAARRDAAGQHDRTNTRKDRRAVAPAALERHGALQPDHGAEEAPGHQRTVIDREIDHDRRQTESAEASDQAGKQRKRAERKDRKASDRDCHQPMRRRAISDMRSGDQNWSATISTVTVCPASAHCATAAWAS